MPTQDETPGAPRPPSPRAPKTFTPEEIEAKVEQYKKNKYTWVPEEAIARTLRSLGPGTRVAYLTKEGWENSKGEKGVRRLLPGGWLIAKDPAKKAPKWFSLMASANGAGVRWSVQIHNLEGILYRLKVEDAPRTPEAATLKRYRGLRKAAAEVAAAEDKTAE